MHPILNVSKSDIQLLNDEQARELIARLCQAVLRQEGLSTEAVMWSGDQRAGDGGVDVRVAIKDAVKINGYIPRINTIFQVKADKAFTNARIVEEMTPKSQLKPAISELARCTGAYIIASTKGDHSDTALNSRKDAMTACIDAAGLTGQIHVDFYDSQKIADWTAQHPAVVIWIKFELGRAIVGWKPYGPWAYREEDVQAEYLLDDKVKIIAPSSNDPITIADAIIHLRKDLREEKTSVRIVGLSGVGKTRLVQALFDARIVPEVAALDRNNVIYTDISDNPSPQPNSMIDALRIDATATVVIVDNCGADTHNKLTALIKQPNSKISLVTLEYDIRDDEPEETQCYRLEASSDELIKKLLALRYPKLTDNDIGKIAEFSSGNARVAFALAATSQKKGQLSKLENEELFVRLFEQKNIPDDNLLRSAEVCSLLYSFDAEDISGTSELAHLASLAEVSILTLTRHVSELQKRGLVQQRGKWKAVLPHAISNRLAGRALKNIPKLIISQKFINQESPRIAKSFAHRLGFLHANQEARDIVRGWLKPGGILSDLAKLNNDGMQIFAYIAPVDQGATLDALLRACQHDAFISTQVFNRQRFIRTVQSLAYEVQYFDQAIPILLRFASVEESGANQHPALKALIALFGCYLSGTLALAAQRAKMVKPLVESNDHVLTNIGVELMMAALKTGHFTSSSNFDFGAHSRGYGWQPQTTDDLIEWYEAFIAIAHSTGASSTPLGAQVRQRFAEKFRGLWAWTGVDLSFQLKNVAETFHRIDGWPDGMAAIQLILRKDKNRIPGSELVELERLQVLLAPQSLIERIRMEVFSQNSFDFFSDDENQNSWEQKDKVYQAKLKQLGELAGKDPDTIIKLLPELLQESRNNNILSFAAGVAQTFNNIPVLLTQAKDAITKIEPSSPDLRFIKGLIDSWNKTDANAVAAFLDDAVDDMIWGKFFPDLQLSVSLDDAGYERFVRAIETGKAPIRQFLYLQYGATAPLSIGQVMTLISSIEKKPGGVDVAIDILQMVIWGSKEKGDVYQQELANQCIYFFQKFDWPNVDNTNQNRQYHLNEILEFTLQAPIAEANIDLILQGLVDFDGEHYPLIERKYLKYFFQYHTKKTLDHIYQTDDDGSYETALKLMTDPYASLHEEHFFQPPTDLVLEWCAISPDDRLMFIAQVCSIFTANQTEIDHDNKIENHISDLAKIIFKLVADKEVILELFVKQFIPNMWSGSRGMLIKSRIPLLSEFDDGHDPITSQILEKAKEKLEEIAENELASEESRNRGQNESFE